MSGAGRTTAVEIAAMKSRNSSGRYTCTCAFRRSIVGLVYRKIAGVYKNMKLLGYPQIKQT
jgi:Tfp pilus assembly ATPase PilU